MDADLPRYLQQLWGLDTGRRRGPKPTLSLDEIGRAAVAVADRDGLDALAGTGLPVPQRLSTLLVVDGYVRSQIALSLQIGAVRTARKPRVRPGTYGQRMAALVDPETFPHLSQSGSAQPGEDFHTA